MDVPLFKRFFTSFSDKKLPSPEMLPKILVSQYEVPQKYASECAELIQVNCRFVGMIRVIGGTPHVMLNASPAAGSSSEPKEPSVLNGAATEEVRSKPGESDKKQGADLNGHTSNGVQVTPALPTDKPKPIFIGHGKNREPCKKLEEILRTFGIPHKVAVQELNLGRPIHQRAIAGELGLAFPLVTKL